MAVWRKEHPTYMRDYCRKYYDKVTADIKAAAKDAAVPPLSPDILHEPDGCKAAPKAL